MSIITRINKAEKRIVDLYNKLKNLPSGGGGVQTISGDFVDNTDPLNPILNDPRPYKVYTALLTQLGTNAPVAIVLENTLGGDIVWSRTVIGKYKGVIEGGFDVNKTYYSCSNNVHYIEAGEIGMDIDFNGDIYISYKSDDVFSDNDLFNRPIEIRVYN